MEENIICHCMNVSEHEIVFTVKNNKDYNLQDIIDVTGGGKGCSACIGKMEAIINQTMKN